jgi:hypothetical protein
VSWAGHGYQLTPFLLDGHELSVFTREAPPWCFTVAEFISLQAGGFRSRLKAIGPTVGPIFLFGRY